MKVYSPKGATFAPMNLQMRSILLALTATLLWSTVGTAFKLTLAHIHITHLLLIASFTSMLIYIILLALTGKVSLIWKMKWQQWANSAILGFLNPFLYYLVLLKAYDILLAQEAGTLNYLWPVVLALLSVPLLGHRLGWKGFLAILISFAGTIVIGTRGQISTLKFTQPAGVGLAVSSAFIWAIFWIFNVRDQREQTIKLFLNFLFGTVYTLFYTLLTTGLQEFSIYGIAGSVYIGLFEMGLTYILWLKALQTTTSAAKISNLVYLSPFISLMIIHLVLKETIYFSTFVGLVLIISGILMQQAIARYEDQRFSPKKNQP